MTKQEIISRIDEAKTVDKVLRDMVVSYVNLAFDSGFEEGMKAATKIQTSVFDLMLHKDDINPHFERRM